MTADFQQMLGYFDRVFFSEGDRTEEVAEIKEGFRKIHCREERQANQENRLVFKNEVLAAEELQFPAQPFTGVSAEHCSADDWPTVISFYDSLSSGQLMHLSLQGCQLTDHSLSRLVNDKLKFQLTTLCLGKTW